MGRCPPCSGDFAGDPDVFVVAIHGAQAVVAVGHDHRIPGAGSHEEQGRQ